MTGQAIARTDKVLLVPPHVEVSAHAPISFGSFRLDRAQRLLLQDGEPVRIGSRALDLLIALIDRAGDIVSRHELLELVWRNVVVDEAGVRVHMASLRRALGDGRDGARYIVNIAGRGYSFVAPIAPNEPDPQPPPPAASLAPRSTGRVPPPPRSLIGREAVITSLSELLLARRFISIVGPGGIGKTTVAAAIVQRLQSAFDDTNVIFVDFGAMTEGRLVPGAVIAAVGCAIGGADPVTELVTFLADKRVLIIFDSCEHLVDPTSLLAGELFQRSPGVHLLVTSRESLRVDGETVHLLSPLAYPADEFPTAPEALATPAVQLFMDRAAYSGFHGELTDSDAPVVGEICRRTDGIALAIELAASRVGTYGIRGVANLLAGNAKLRLAGRRNVVPRHQTLEAMLDWSFELLAELEQRVLSRLSVFVGLFSIEAACSVAGSAGDDGKATMVSIASLVDKSMLWVQPVGKVVFYRLADVTRAYAATKLQEVEELEPISRRHARYFASLLKGVALEHGAYADMRPYAPHISNVRKALEWSFSDPESHAVAVELAADAVPLFLGLWLLSEGRHWSRLALSASDEIKELPRRELRLPEAPADSAQNTQNDAQEFPDAIEPGPNLLEADGGEMTRFRLLAGLNSFLTTLGDFEGGLAAAKRCGIIAERIGALSDRVIAEWMLAAAYHLGGDQAAAMTHCERGFALEAEIGHPEFRLFGYDHHLRAELALSRILWLRGSPARACRLVLEAMEGAALSSLHSNYSMAAANGVAVLLWSGNSRESGTHIDRLIAHVETHPFKLNAAAALALKGEWLVMVGEPLAGIAALQEALKMLNREQFQMVVPGAARALADGLAQSGQYREAQTMIDEVTSSAERMGQKFWLPDLYRTKGEINLKAPSPDVEAAEQAFLVSIKLAGEQGAIGWELKAAIPLARLLIGRERAADAIALLTPIYEAHSERTGTTDLADAKSLLESLR
ncbi:winged helix-turn-helix domain-containing protein [Mesorhizobium sp. M0408]|uniref:ATP-binding protein n=1 Tax=Mesorhizobium sp. M0408 TaxID=2956942 RepID=UPI00333BF1DC